MTTPKTKLFTNPARKQSATYKPYVPTYKVLDIEPSKIAPSFAPMNEKTSKMTNVEPNFTDKSPRNRNPGFKQELPNVGNNMETAWNEGEILNDVVIFDEDMPESINPNQMMIDNNYDDENNYRDIPNEIESPLNQSNLSFNIADGEYVLIVKGTILGYGSLSVMEEEVKSLVFGDHSLNEMNEIMVDDILVLKKISIKIGVFLE